MIAAAGRRGAPAWDNKNMNARIPRNLQMVAAVLFAACCWTASAQDDSSAYIRHVRAADDSPMGLEVAIAGFESPSGARVDLVSAIHVADRDYFAELDRRLADYEAVLYELVGEPGQVRAPRGATPSMVGLLQGGMKNALGLAFQLDEIDYGRANMVHADLTPGAFSDSMRERSESLGGMMFRAWAMAMAEQGAGKSAGQEADFLKVLFADDRQRALKRVLASQLADQVDLLDTLAGENGSTLITVRNQRAMEVLAEQLGAGAGRIAIFYGAGHMPDFETRLVEEFGMRKISTEWIEAWDLR